jgi:hypothetical protein
LHMTQRTEPSGYCSPCGISANVLTCLKKYGHRPNQLCFSVSTWHKGVCAACGEEAMVTEERDFFYPDFELLAKKTKNYDFREEE